MSDITNQNLNTLATEINSIKDQTRKIVLANSIEIGRRLSDAKSICEFGEWGQWLRNSVNYSDRTAQQLMKIFDEYSSSQINFIGESNTKALADLSYTQALILMGIPKEEREEFAQENNIDELSTRELQEMVKENKKLKEDKDKTDEQIESLEKAIDEDIERLNKSNSLINELTAKIEEADKYNDEAGQEKINKLKEDLKKQKSDNKIIAKKLKEEKDKPIEAVTVEVVPEEMKEELAALKARLGKDDSPEVVRIRYIFKQVVSQFDSLLNEINTVNKTNEETGEKLYEAAKHMTSTMFEKILDITGCAADT